MSSTSSDDTLATEAGIQTYLRNTPFASHTVDLLSGGYINFTYRIHLHVPVDGMSTFILKYAPPYAASLTNLSILSPDRQVFIHISRICVKYGAHTGILQRFEAEALRLANIIPKPDDDNTVTVPTLRFLDQESHVMIIDDAGSDTRTLREVLIDETLPRHLLEEIGTKLGRFLAHIHGWNERPDVDLNLFANNEARKMVSTYLVYSQIISTLTGEDRLPHLVNPALEIPKEKLETVSKLVETRTKEIHSSTASDVMTHGDYWPGNILVSLRRGTESAIEALDRLYVLDWELAMIGLPGSDLGQYCAELYIIARFLPHREESAKTIISSFLSAYRQSRAIDSATARVALGHIGGYMVTWVPRDVGDRERIRELVLEGVELLDLSWTGPESSLVNSIVGPLLSGKCGDNLQQNTGQLTDGHGDMC